MSPLNSGQAPKGMTDLEFMQTPDNWPKWPILPMVERVGGRCGIVLPDLPTVFIGNIFTLKRGPLYAQLRAEWAEVKYTDFASLLEEWRID